MMLQGKNKRKQEKIFQKVKFLTLLSCVCLILAIGGLLHAKFFTKEPLFLNPLSTKYVSPFDIADSLSKKKIAYSSIEEHVDFYKISIKGDGIVFISRNKSIDQQLTSLQLIRDRLKIEGKVFKSLDLRFDQPVVKL